MLLNRRAQDPPYLWQNVGKYVQCDQRHCLGFQAAGNHERLVLSFIFHQGANARLPPVVGPGADLKRYQLIYNILNPCVNCPLGFLN